MCWKQGSTLIVRAAQWYSRYHCSFIALAWVTVWVVFHMLSLCPCGLSPADQKHAGTLTGYAKVLQVLMSWWMCVHGVLTCTGEGGITSRDPETHKHKRASAHTNTHTAVWSVVEMHNGMCSLCFSTFEAQLQHSSSSGCWLLWSGAAVLQTHRCFLFFFNLLNKAKCETQYNCICSKGFSKWMNSPIICTRCRSEGG